MGLRIQKRINLGKFLRLNISKSGIGVSAGVPGLRVGVGPQGPYFSIGLPGSGISYRSKISSRGREARATPRAEAQAMPPAEIPSPGFFASRHEKELVKGLNDYQAGQVETALEHFLAAAPDEPGAAILAASILAKQDSANYQAVELLEGVVQSDGEFPTPLMEKYVGNMEVEIEITPNVTVFVSINGLAATLLLVELYQAQRRVREAIALLEEVEELAHEPVVTLSLCELYASRELWDSIIERAQGIEPEDDVTLEIAIYYGLAMLEKGLSEAAASVFTKAVRRKKDRNPDLLREAAYWRAIIYEEQGKRSQANKEFQRIFAEDPNFRDVAERLADASVR